MEIHKPHAAKTWKEFFIELGTIVLGICIALAGEQTLEWLRWRSQVQEAREVIATETASNLAGAIRRIRTIQCGERRLDALAKILDDAARSGSLPPVGIIGQPPRSRWRSGAWESVVASQTATHFPRQQLADLGDLYKIVERADQNNAMETLAWRDLYTMVGPGRRLDPASEAQLRSALSQARDTGRSLAIMGAFLMRQASTLNLPFSQADRDAIAQAQHKPLTGEVASLEDGSPMSLLCEPIGPVPPNYGQAPGNANPALANSIAKSVPDFGAAP